MLDLSDKLRAEYLKFVYTSPILLPLDLQLFHLLFELVVFLEDVQVMTIFFAYIARNLDIFESRVGL